MTDTIGAMIDPVTRAARRQNAIDRVAELLTDWGCPPDTTPGRAALILETIEQQGWRVEAEAPPLQGRGSTDEGRARARRVLFHTRAGCTCGIGAGAHEVAALVGAPPEAHPTGCPVRDAHDLGAVGATS